jgi:2-hydroxy-3-keto-5-methylthiopentenyl-1-phosphate phosphatase
MSRNVPTRSVPPSPPNLAQDAPLREHALRVILDFDGTLVEPNVAIVLVAEFGENGAEIAHEIDELLHTGKIGLREAWMRQVKVLPADRIDEMANYVRKNVPLRAGAREFLSLAQCHHVPVTIVSGGLDFYISEVLDREGLKLPVRSDRISVLPSGVVQVEHPFGHPTCRLCGICKAGVVAPREPFPRTVFIADGSTDKYGAEVADIIFARRRLLDYCRRVGLPCFPFEDFGPVTEQFSRWLEDGEPLPAPRRPGLETSLCPISREGALGDPVKLSAALAGVPA